MTRRSAKAQETRTRGKNVRKNVQNLSIANSSLGTKKKAIGKKDATFSTLMHGKRKDTLLFLDRGSAHRATVKSGEINKHWLREGMPKENLSVDLLD